MIPPGAHLNIGCLLFDGLDQIDLTGPFEVLSRLPNATCRLYAETAEPVRDLHGLRLLPDATLAEAPKLDVLLVPGGAGQETLMDDQVVLGWIAAQAADAACVLSVCTGALLCGAAGLLRGRRATTHWSCLHLLPLFGAVAVPERVVFDGNFVFAAGVTAGLDGALRLAASLRGAAVAQAIQLHMAYAPEPPFSAGTPETAPPAILAQARVDVRPQTARREHTARRIAARLGIAAPDAAHQPNASAQPHPSPEEHAMTITFTKTAPPAWLLAMWREIDEKTFGAGFDCFAEDAVCNLGVADWHGRETLRRNLRAFVDRGLTARHDVVEYLDSPLLKIFHGKVHMMFDDPALAPVTPTMTHFFYMDATDPSKVSRWVGAVGPTGF